MATLKDYSFRGKSLVGDVFIETGTCKAHTIKEAAKAGFLKCYSIEFSQELYEESKRRLGDDYPTVTLLHGSSPKLLRPLLDGTKRTTFWLDAHYCGGGDSNQVDSEYGECPLIHEIGAIFSIIWMHKPVLIIDDAQMFVREGRRARMVNWSLFDKGQWPCLDEIAALLPGYDIFDEDDKLYCIPKDHNW